MFAGGGNPVSHPVYRAIFDGRRAARAGWPFTYTYDATPDKLHADAKMTVLSNGAFGNAEKTPGSKDSATGGLSPRGHLERQAEFHASTQDEA